MNVHHLLLAPICITLLLGTTMKSSPVEPVPAGERVTASYDELFDLVFKGGTSADFVDAIRKVVPDTNIVVMPNAMKVPMPALQLNSVTVGTALMLLEDRTAQLGSEYIELHVKYFEGDRIRNESNIYSVVAEGFSSPSRTSIYSVSDLLSGDLSSDDLITSIETTLDLLSDSYAPAQIRFHPATSILIVRGHPDQVEAVKDLIGELQDTVNRRKRDADRNAQQEKAQQDAQRMSVKLEEVTGMNAEMKLELTEKQARYELLEQELNRVREQLAQRDAEQRALADQNHLLATRIQELERNRKTSND